MTAAPTISAKAKAKWKYHRSGGINGASKWILGTSWVTKLDREGFCHIGFKGRYMEGVHPLTVKGARTLLEAWIEGRPF